MTPANPSHALALTLVDELARTGVTDAVLAPGSRSTALAMALHDDPRLRLHVEVDERSAGFCAIGIGRISGTPAAVVVTSGSAVANLHPAVVEADTGHVPLLLLTADRPPELRDTGANQAIDQLHLFGRSVRWFHELGVPDAHPSAVVHWRSTVSRAVAEARGFSAAAGPVHLNLPFREPTVPAADDGRSTDGPAPRELAGRPDRRPWTSAVRAPRLLDDADLSALAGRIAGTERGLVVLGATSADVAPALDLARAAGYPVIAEPPSNGRLPGALAHAHQLASHPRFAAAHRPDLVLRVGRAGLSRAVAGLLGADVPQLLLDPDGGWPDPDRTLTEVLAVDPTRTCATLAAQLPFDGSSAWSDRWHAADEAVAAALDAVLDDDEVPSEPRLARDLCAVLPEATTLVVGSSMPIRDVDLFARPRRGLRIVANRGASGIDGTVSTALGVAVAEATAPGADRHPPVALLGDLTALHDAAGWLLSPDLPRLDAVFVVVDNDGGGIFHFLPQAAFPGPFERVFGTPHGRDLADLARFHRLGYRRIDIASELGEAVSEAQAAGGLHLLHVRTDRDRNRQLHQQLTAAAHAAIDALA